MKRKMLAFALMAVVLLFSVSVIGCSNSNGLQTEPLAQTDTPVVLAAKEKVVGETAATSFKIKVYDSNIVPQDGGVVDYQMEYRKRTSSIGVTLWDGLTGDWKENFTFPVVNGWAYARMKGLAPGAYRVTVRASSVEDRLTFFFGEGTLVLGPGENKFTKIYLEPQQSNYVGVRVNGLPIKVPEEGLGVQSVLTTVSGDTRYDVTVGYQYEGLFTFWVELPMYPDPATKLKYSFQDKNGDVYIQDVSFDILGLIDRVIETGYYDVSYEADTDVVIGFVFPGGYIVSASPSLAEEWRVLGPDVTGFEMARFDIRASNEPKAIQRMDLGLKSTSPSMIVDIVRMDVFDGATLLGSGVLDLQSGECAVTFMPVLRLPLGVTKTLSVKIDSAPLMFFSPKSGDWAQIFYLSSSGVNLTTGEEVGDATERAGQITAYVPPEPTIGQ